MGIEDFDIDIKYSDGLEFKTDEKSDGDSFDTSLSKEQEAALKVIIREGFRAPVKSSEEICLLIGSQSYPVFNLSVSGLGIIIDDLGNVESKSILKGMALQINDKEFYIDGQVIHVSQDDAQYLCGIHIVKMADECKKEIFSYLQKSRKSLFS